MTRKDKKLAQIRARSSYLLFKQLYEFLKDNPSVVDILGKFPDILDAKKSFDSERNAERIYLLQGHFSSILSQRKK